MTVVLAAHTWANNAAMIADVAQLGYLDGHVLDASYGLGRFWTRWKPEQFTAHDIDPAKAPDGPADFRALDYPDAHFDAVVLDGPYKLNGTPTEAIDAPYGVHVPATRDERMALCVAGIVECARVARTHLLVKCQDQVNGGKVRWQTRIFADIGEECGFRLVDRFDLLGKHRPQPMEGRRQEHAHGRPSTLLVFRREGPPPVASLPLGC